MARKLLVRPRVGSMSPGWPIRTPPLRLLRTFYFAAKHASFKAAAERLALTPSAVSHQVKELEEQLGVPLFQRRTRAIALTATGRQLLEELEPALAALHAAVVRASRGSTRRHLHVVMPPFFASELFAPRLHDFHHRHPSIDIQVDTRDPRPDQHPVYSDVSVLLSNRSPDDDVEAVRLFPLRLVAACSRELSVALGRVDHGLLRHHALIMHRTRPDAWERWAGQVGFDIGDARNVVEFDSMFAVARAAERGAGIALVPAVLCQPWFDSGALVRLEALEVDTQDAYYLVARRDDLERPEVQALTAWTLQQFQEGA
jgi:LysR family glycine cleavage system transcriptional activator